MYKKIAIFFILLALLISPRFLQGWQNLHTAEKAKKEGNNARAAEAYQLAAQRLPGRAELWNAAAQAYWRAGNQEDAIQAYQRAQEKGVLSALGYDLLGQNLWAQGNSPAAYQTWQAGKKRYPDYLDYHLRLIGYYREQNDFQAERDSLAAWLSQKEPQSTNAAYYYRLGLLQILDDPAQAVDSLDAAARADDQFASVVETLRVALNLAALTENPAESIITRGRGLGLAGEWQLAASLFYNATQAEPANASAWAWLGEAYAHLNQDPLPALDQALLLQPDSGLVRSLRGLYFQREGELEKALGEFEAAAEAEPENEYWQIAIGETYARLGDLPLALEAYEEAAALDPSNADVWHFLALFSLDYAGQVEEVGLPAARKAVILAPENATFADTLGRVHFALAEDEEAEKFFLHALELDPNLASAHLHLGLFYVGAQQLGKAYQSLLDARRLGENTPAGEEAARLLEIYFSE